MINRASWTATIFRYWTLHGHHPLDPSLYLFRWRGVVVSVVRAAAAIRGWMMTRGTLSLSVLL